MSVVAIFKVLYTIFSHLSFVTPLLPWVKVRFFIFLIKKEIFLQVICMVPYNFIWKPLFRFYLKYEENKSNFDLAVPCVFIMISIINFCSTYFVPFILYDPFISQKSHLSHLFRLIHLFHTT